MARGGVDIARLGLRLDGRQMRAETARVDSSLRAVGKTAGSVQGLLLKLGVTLSAGLALRKAAKDAGEFAGAMQRSLAIMGNVDTMMRGRMVDAARKVGVELNLGASKAAEAYFYLASAGLTAEQSVVSLDAVARFAKAGMFDMAQATDLATDAQSALGLKTADTQKHLENLTRVTDVLVKANTLANANVQQFSESLTNKAGAALRLLNKDVEEGVAVLAVYADQGVKGSEAGEKLNIVLRDLQRAVRTNARGFEDMNISIYDANGNVRNLADIIENLTHSFSGMSDEQLAASLAMLGFQDRSVSALKALLGTSDAIRTYEKNLRQAGGITKEVSDKQMLAPLERVGRAMKEFGEVAIDAGNQVLKYFVPGIEGAAKHARDLADAFVSLIEAAALLTAGLAAIGLAGLIWGIKALTVAEIAAAVATLNLAAAWNTLMIAIGPGGWFLLGVTALAAILFKLKKEQRDVAEESKKQEELYRKEAEAVKTLSGETLQLTQLLVKKALIESVMKRSAGDLDEEGERKADRDLALLHSINLELQERVRLNDEISNTDAPTSARGGSSASDATRTAMAELERQKALNAAFGQGEEALALLNLEYDRRATLIENSAAATGKDLALLNELTNALFDQKRIALELATAKEKANLASSNDLELEKQRALAEAIGQSEEAIAALSREYERRQALLQNEASLSGEALRIANEYTNALYDQKEATANLLTAEEQRKRVETLQREVDAQLRMNEAQKSGKAAVDQLRITLAGENAVFALGVGVVKEYADEVRRLAEEKERLRIQGDEDAKDAAKLPDLYEQAAKGIQQAFAAGFNKIQQDGLRGFEDMANAILDIFQSLASEIASLLVAEKLGLDDLIKKLREGGELSTNQKMGGAALVGYGIGTATGSGLQGAAGGAAAGAAIGGAPGAIVGGISGFVSGMWEGAKRAQEAAEEMRKAVNQFNLNIRDSIRALEVSGGSEWDRVKEGLRVQINERIREFEELFDLKGGRRFGRMSPDQTFEDLVKWMQIFSTEGRAAIDGNAQALEAWNLILQETVLAIQKAEEAEAKRVAAVRAGIDDDLYQREANLLGEREGLIARIEIKYRQEIKAAQDLVDAGDMTQEQFERLQKVLIGEGLQALRDFEEGIREVAEAAKLATDALVADLAIRGMNAVGGNSRDAQDWAREARNAQERLAAKDQAPEVLALMDLVHIAEGARIAHDRAVQDVQDAANAQLAALDKQIDIASEQLRLAEADLRIQERVVDTLKQTSERLKEFNQGLLLGDKSPLSPVDRLAEAQKQFDTLAALAKAGDITAAQSLPGAGSDLLSAARAVYASTEGYANIFNATRSTLSQVETNIDEQLIVEEKILSELKRQTNQLNSQIQELQDQKQAVIDGANAQIAELNAIWAQESAKYTDMINKLIAIIQAIYDTGPIISPLPPDPIVPPISVWTGTGGPSGPSLPPPPPPPPPPINTGSGPGTGTGPQIASTGGAGGSGPSIAVMQQGFAGIQTQLQQVTAAVNQTTQQVKRSIATIQS